MSFFLLANLGPDAETAIPALSKSLTNDNADIRMRAAITLWKIDRKAAISLPPLLAVLTDKEMRSSDRSMAANCLFSIGPDAKSAVAALTAAMGEDDLKLRTVCAAALWKIAGDWGATIPVLMLSLKGEDFNAYDIAARTLAEIISTLREDPAREALDEQLTRQISEALEKALEDENLKKRRSLPRIRLP